MNPIAPDVIERMSEIAFFIFGAAALTGFVLGPFLTKIGANKYWRIVVYYLAGVGAGTWYASSIGAATAVGPNDLSIAESVAMYVFALIVIGWVVLAKNRKLKQSKPN